VTGRLSTSIAVLLALGVLTGCGGSSSHDVAVPSSRRQLDADTSLAKRAVLHLADMPDGYKAVAVESPSANRSAERTLLACLQLADARGRPDRVQVTGALFSQPLGANEARQVVSSVVIHTTSADMERPFVVLGQSRSATCLATYFRTRFAADESLSKLHPREFEVRTLPTTSIRGIGDERAVFRGSFVLTVVGRVVNASFDYLLVRRGRAVAILVVQGLNTTFPPSQAASLLRTIIDRLAPAA
jgi:hypothetical protein